MWVYFHASGPSVLVAPGGCLGQVGQRTMRAIFAPLGQVGHGHERFLCTDKPDTGHWRCKKTGYGRWPSIALSRRPRREENLLRREENLPSLQKGRSRLHHLDRSTHPIRHPIIRWWLESDGGQGGGLCTAQVHMGCMKGSRMYR